MVDFSKKSAEGRILQGNAPIHTHRKGEKSVKIGFLSYKFILNEVSPQKSYHVFENSFASTNVTSPNPERKDFVDINLVFISPLFLLVYLL